MGHSLWHFLFVIVCTNFKIVKNLKLIANMNHAVKMYPMHTFENISHNWIIFPTHSRVRDNANNLKQNIT